MINMLRALINKVNSMQEQMGNESKDGYPKKKPTRNVSDQKH